MASLDHSGPMPARAASAKKKANTAVNPDSDILWGAQAIGFAINRSAPQVFHLIASGALNGAVKKFGPPPSEGTRDTRKLVGSRKKLITLLSGDPA